MRGDVEGAAGSWLISLIAGALLFWAVMELLELRGGPQVGGFHAVSSVATEPGALPAFDSAIELHRLLPDATGSIGRTVRLDGSIVGEASALGFWVRDLRDNIVFVTAGAEGRSQPRDELRAGDAVRVYGVIARLSPIEQAERLSGAGLVLPSSAIVVRDIEILAAPDGIEVLLD